MVKAKFCTDIVHITAAMNFLLSFALLPLSPSLQGKLSFILSYCSSFKSYSIAFLIQKKHYTTMALHFDTIKKKLIKCMDIIERKKELRKKYREIRKNISEDYAIYAANLISKTFIKNIILKKDSVIAGYIPRDLEIDAIPLMQKLQLLGHKIVVPVIDKGSDYLLFQEWKINSQIENYVIPNIVIMSLIAFGQNLNRLGFGNGWYDRTIKKLRILGSKFIGIAYEVQYCEQLPVEDHDQVLDNVITDNNFY